MSSLTDDIFTQISGGALQQISQQLGTGQAQTAGAIAAALPDAAGLHAAQRLLQWVQGLTPDDVVLCLVSGGGSALLACPPAAGGEGSGRNPGSAGRRRSVTCGG